MTKAHPLTADSDVAKLEEVLDINIGFVDDGVGNAEVVEFNLVGHEADESGDVFVDVHEEVHAELRIVEPIVVRDGVELAVEAGHVEVDVAGHADLVVAALLERSDIALEHLHLVFKGCDLDAEKSKLVGKLDGEPLEGTKVFGGNSAAPHFFDEPADDHGEFVTGEGLVALEGAVLVTLDVALCGELGNSVICPVGGLDIGEGGTGECHGGKNENKQCCECDFSHDCLH